MNFAFLFNRNYIEYQQTTNNNKQQQTTNKQQFQKSSTLNLAQNLKSFRNIPKTFDIKKKKKVKKSLFFALQSKFDH